MSAFLEAIQSHNFSEKRIKITFDRYLYWNLNNLFPAQVSVAVKDKKYIYYDELSASQQYQLAVYIFKKLFIIFNDGIEDKIDFGKIKYGYRDNKVIKVSELEESEIIEAFKFYVIKVNDIFSVNYKNESTQRQVSNAVFLDADHRNIEIWETDVKKFILNAYKAYLMTGYGNLPFMPRYGSNIKNYLNTLTLHQTVDMVQGELNELTSEILQYLKKKLGISISVDAKVKIKNTEAFDTYEMSLSISIDDQVTVFKLI